MQKVLLSSFLAANCLLASAFAYPQVQISHPDTHTPLVSKIGSNVLDLSDLVKTGMQLAVRNSETGVISYTSDGVFLKRNGYFYQRDGRLQGFSLPATLTADACTLMDVKAPDEELNAKATSTVYLSLNLNAADVIPKGPFDEAKPDTYNYNSTVIIFDEVGAEHYLKEFYAKKTANNWTVHVKMDGVYITKGDLVFRSTGELASTTGLDEVIFTPPGRQNTQQIKFDLSGTTQMSSPDSFINLRVDGYPRGNLVEEIVDANGYISSRYSNAQSITFSKIAVYAH